MTTLSAWQRRDTHRHHRYGTMYPYRGPGSSKGMSISVEELERKQLNVLQARVVASEEENKTLRERAETVGTTTAGTARRAERLSVKGMSDGSCVDFSFNNGHRRNGSGFPGGGVGQQ